MKKILTLSVFIILMMVVFLVKKIDHKEIYQKIINNGSVNIVNLDKSHIKIKYFPFPHIIINKITGENFESKNVKIGFTLSSLLRLNPEIGNVYIDQLILASDEIENINYEGLIRLLTKYRFPLDLSVNRLEINKKSIIVKEFKSSQNNYSGNINEYRINASITQDNLLNIEINGRDDLVKIKQYWLGDKLGNGSVSIISDTLLHKVLGIFDNLHEFSSLISMDKGVRVKFDIYPNAEYLLLNNIEVKSKNVNGLGEIKISKNRELNVINFRFSEIDLISGSKLSSVNSSSYINIVNKISPLKINLLIDRMKWHQSHEVRDVNINLLKKNKSLSTNIKGSFQKGDFNIDGVVMSDDFSTNFLGKIAVQHYDLNRFIEIFDKNLAIESKVPFSLSSEIKLSPVECFLDNLLLVTNDAKITGDMSTRFIGKTPMTNAKIRFTSLDLDKPKFPIFSNLLDRLTDLSTNMDDKKYLSKFTFLRNLTSHNRFDLTFDNLSLYNTKYNNINFLLRLLPGHLSIEQLFLTHKKNWIDASFSLDARQVKPMVKFIIHNASLRTDFSISAISKLRSFLVKNINFNKVNFVANGKLRRLYDNNFLLEKVKFNLNSDGNLLNITQFDVQKIFEGSLESSGNILLSPYTPSFVYALNSVNLKNLSNLIPKQFPQLNGVMSINGKIETRGNDAKSQLYNLYTKSSFIAKNIILKGLSIDDFIRKINKQDYQTQNLSNDSRKMLLTGKTKLIKLTGDININHGIVNFSDLKLKSETSNSDIKAKLNIYNLSMALNSIFRFNLAKPQFLKNVINYSIPANMKITVDGNILSIKKYLDIKNLEERLRAIRD